MGAGIKAGADADAMEGVDAEVDAEDVFKEDNFDAIGKADKGEAGAAPWVAVEVDDFWIAIFEGFSTLSTAGKIALIFLQISMASKPSC